MTNLSNQSAPDEAIRGMPIEILEESYKILREFIVWSTHIYNRKVGFLTENIITNLLRVLDATPEILVKAWNNLKPILLIEEIKTAFPHTLLRKTQPETGIERRIFEVIVVHLFGTPSNKTDMENRFPSQ